MVGGALLATGGGCGQSTLHHACHSHKAQAVSPFCFVYRRMSKVLAFFKLARKCGKSLVSKFKTCNEWFTKNALLGLIALQLLQTKPGNKADIT